MIERNRKLAQLLIEAEAWQFDPGEAWYALARQELRTPPSDDPLERELYALVTEAMEHKRVDSYEADRAVAEARGLVGRSGDIIYQERWLFEDGHWGEWRTYRTKDWDRYPLPKPLGGRESRHRIASADEAA